MGGPPSRARVSGEVWLVSTALGVSRAPRQLVIPVPAAVRVTKDALAGGPAGPITAAGAWALAGNWATPGAVSVFPSPSSADPMSGPAKTVKILNASNGFAALTISGPASAASALAT